MILQIIMAAILIGFVVNATETQVLDTCMLFKINTTQCWNLYGGSVYGWGENHGDNKKTEDGCNWKSLKEYARSVDDMKCLGDDVDTERILNLHDVDEDEEKCIKHRADLGNELYEDEILKCYHKNN